MGSLLGLMAAASLMQRVGQRTE